MKRRRVIRIVVLIVAATAVSVWLGRRLTREPGPGTTLRASGTVEATEVHLGFPSGGRLATLTVAEGDAVTAGTSIAELDQAELRAKRDQARAQAQAARALLTELERGSRPQEIRSAAAARDAGKVRLDQARREAADTRTLYEEGIGTRKAYDDAVAAAEVARTQLEQAEQQLGLARTGPRTERIAGQREQVALADAAVALAEAALANAVIVAPIGGVVTTRHREPGEIVPPGTAVVTLMNPDDRWVRIYVEEDRIAAVRLGAPAQLGADTYPTRRYAGEVAFIASEAEFTPKNVQTQKERVRLVYAVKVRITGDPVGDLKPGIPVDVELDLRRPRGAQVAR